MRHQAEFEFRKLDGRPFVRVAPHKIASQPPLESDDLSSLSFRPVRNDPISRLVDGVFPY
jgi:hypothetical protein